MKKFLCLLLLGSACHADYLVVVKSGMPVDQYPYEVVINKSQADLDALGARTGAYPGRFPALVDTEYGVWTVIDWSLEQAELALIEKLQNAKPETQRDLESSFFTLCRTVETAAGATATTAKLGFDEIEAYIDIISTTDPMTAMQLSLKLMSINSALIRYDIKWWDYAKDFSE